MPHPPQSDPPQQRDLPPPYQPPSYETQGVQTQPAYYIRPTETIVVTPQVISVNVCPACQRGTLRDNFTCLGIFCAIFFFPLGLFCCLFMTVKRCNYCGAAFG